MTPADEAQFIQLWQAGVETAEIAHRLGIPPGTVSSRTHALQQRGLIQPRPRGGPHARRVVQARQAGTPAAVPVQRPVKALDTGAEHSADHCTAPLLPR
jgi:DNA-binding IclR family transcriptional regulator